MKRDLLLIRIAVFLLLPILVGGFASPSAKAEVQENYNVIIVLIDALRFDHLGCYGYSKDTSPYIDRLSEKSLVYENAISQGSWTKPAVMALFTSNYVKDHRVAHASEKRPEVLETSVLLPSAFTLAEAFSENGYKTVTFFRNNLLKKGFGFEQGFEEYQFALSEHHITTDALDWIDEHHKTNFFMYLHYMSPHTPFNPPHKHKIKFKEHYQGTIDFSHLSQKDLDSLDMTGEDLEELRAQYDGEVSRVDSEVGQLIDYLERKGLFEKTLLIVMADHGEALFENKDVGHGKPYNAVIQVPLIVFLPGNKEQKRIPGIVELIDVAPSVLAHLNIEVPPSFKGVNIFDHPDEVGKPFAFTQSRVWNLIRSQDYLFKKKRGKKKGELYDLKTDPFELNDISKDNPGQMDIFMSQDEYFMEKIEKIETDSREIDPQLLERLKSLGYL